MANGKHGDHPINDICDHGLAVFSPSVDGLIRDIHEYLPQYRMWDLFDWFNPPPMPEFERMLTAKLVELRASATSQGWETK